MSHPPLNAVNVFAAAFPLIVVLYLMIGRNWGGSKAGPVGWLAAIVMAILYFGANVDLLLVAFGRSLLLAFYVLYIIWMALLLYHVVNDAGAIGIIGRDLPKLAADPPSQALLLGWVFGSFLQGASGFGVPAAVVAPLLVGLGFAANSAVVIALVGHAWAVTFGSLASSFFALIAATGLSGATLSLPSALLLGICCLACGAIVLWETGRRRALTDSWARLLVVGLVMASVQLALAAAGLWSLASFGAGIAGLLVIVIDLRYAILVSSNNRSRKVGVAVSDNHGARPASKPPDQTGRDATMDLRQLFKASVPYLILIAVIVSGQLLFQETLSFLILDPIFPEVETRFGWVTTEGPGRSISIFGHAGALLLYSSFLSYLWFRWRGPFTDASGYSTIKIVRKTVSGSIRSTIGIVTLVAMAVTMTHAAMTQLLAEVLSAGTGPIFPLLSPFIGALGAFMTGSNTNSNVVFGQLQQETALALGISVTMILAAQTAGGAIGSLFAPAKVIVGCSTVPGAEDGVVLKKATLYGLLMIGLIGLIIWSLV